MTKKTRIINKVEVKDLDKAVELKVITKCPTKWILIDEETGTGLQGF